MTTSPSDQPRRPRGVSQYVVLDALRPRLDAWLASQGFHVGAMPGSDPEGLPTLLVVPTDELLGLRDTDEVLDPQRRLPGPEDQFHPDADLSPHPVDSLVQSVTYPDRLSPFACYRGDVSGVKLCVHCSHAEDEHLATPYVNETRTWHAIVIECTRDCRCVTRHDQTRPAPRRDSRH